MAAQTRSGQSKSGIRTVVGIYSVTDRIVVVRVGNGSAEVRLLPNSAVPVPGDSVLVVETDKGLVGIALEQKPPSANLSINLPIATGDVPTAGLYVPVLSDFPATIIGVRMVLLDAAGASVSDTCTLDVRRTDFATGSTTNLNPSSFGPSADYKYEDTALTSWNVDIAAHDTLQASLVSAPTTAVFIGVALEVVRA